MDIQWLQRDFSLYVVNLFDTFQAAMLLKLKRKSLKFLLASFCNIDTDKKLRCTDWRIRPLRPELIEYARKDTHYLLYVFDVLTNALIDKSTQNTNLLTECYALSAQTCCVRYEKPRFDANGWQTLCAKKGWYFINNKSLNALAKLYEWRDRIGRKLDQSVSAVLSNQKMKRIATDLPQNEKDLKKYHLSVIAGKYKQDILDLIHESLNLSDKESLDPMFEVSANSNAQQVQQQTVDLNAISCSNEGRFKLISTENH